MMLKKYIKVYDRGTMNMKERKSFFGSKMMDIEDDIIIDNRSIQYSEVTSTDNYGYQYFDVALSETEDNITNSLNDLKKKYHTISTQTQDLFNLKYNTKWVIDVDAQNILRDYLFYKIKEARSFKTIKRENTKRKDINLSIYDYVDYNIIDRYMLTSVDLYINYLDIVTDSSVVKPNIKQYDIQFDDGIYDSSYYVKDFNLIKNDNIESLGNIKIIYSQIKNSDRYRMDYYFNLVYQKI